MTILAPSAPAAAGDAPQTIMGTVPDWLRRLAGRQLSPRTIETYRKDLVRFVTWLEQRLGRAATPADITPRAIEDWQDDHAHLNGASHMKLISALHSYCTWAARRGLCADDPTELVERPRRPDVLPRALTTTQLAGLEALLSRPLPVLNRRRRWLIERDHRAILLMLYAGLRLSEAADLAWAHVDLTAHTLTVHQGKGNRSRVVPLHPRLRAALLLIPERERVGYVAGGQGGRRVLGKALARMFEARGWLRTDWQITMSAHQLRHTFATNLMRAGVSMRNIQLLLGHRSLEVTQKYLRVDPDDQVRAIAALPSVLTTDAAPAPQPRPALAPRQGPSRPCAYCTGPLPMGSRPTRRFCSDSCKCRDARARAQKATDTR